MQCTFNKRWVCANVPKNLNKDFPGRKHRDPVVSALDLHVAESVSNLALTTGWIWCSEATKSILPQ